MTDLLPAHAANQPDKLAVAVDRGDGQVRPLTYAELEARSNQLARYKTPRSISWLAGLQKAGSGKVLKRELRQPFWEGHGSNV